MSTPDDEFEATMWSLMRTHQVACPVPAAFLDAVKYAAMRYAAGDSDALTAVRREVLERDTAEQTPASTRGGVTGTAPELNPPGSGAFPQGAGDGGATPVHRVPIPRSVTSGDARFSTGSPARGPGVAPVVHRGVDKS